MKRGHRLFNDTEVILIAKLYIENYGTIERIANKLCTSKSTIYRCITIYIKDVDYKLYNECKNVRECNKLNSRFKRK